jgi:hypothetical protein
MQALSFPFDVTLLCNLLFAINHLRGYGLTLCAGSLDS